MHNDFCYTNRAIAMVVYPQVNSNITRERGAKEEDIIRHIDLLKL